MDQATAAVWASAVAGFSSAAGAALGAAMAGRATRVQDDRTALREKQTRREVDLEACFKAFRDKVNDAISAFHDVPHALAADRSVSDESAKKAYVAAYLSYIDGIWSSGQMEVVHAAGVVCARLDAALTVIGALTKSPHEAKDPESPGMRQWRSCLGDLSSTYQTTSRLMGEIVRGM